MARYTEITFEGITARYTVERRWFIIDAPDGLNQDLLVRTLNHLSTGTLDHINLRWINPERYQAELARDQLGAVILHVPDDPDEPPGDVIVTGPPLVSSIEEARQHIAKVLGYNPFDDDSPDDA